MISGYFSDSVDKELPEKLFIQLDIFKFTCGEDSSKVDDNVNMLANKKDNSLVSCNNAVVERCEILQ